MTSFAEIAVKAAGQREAEIAQSNATKIKLADMPIDQPQPTEYIETSHDAFAFSHSESTDILNERGTELEALLEESLRIAVTELLKRL